MAASQQDGRRKDRTVSYAGLFRLHDWLFLGPLALVGLALGAWGFATCEDCGASGGLGTLIKSVGLIRASQGYTHPWQLVIAQVLMPGLFLIGGAKLLLLNLRRDLRVAMAWRQANHTIVCGLGDTGRQIVENLLADRQPVVAITLDDTDPNAAACEQLGVAVLKGDATQVGMLRLAGLLRADTVVATCGADTVNIEIALRIKSALDVPEEHHQALSFLPETMRVRLLEWLRTTPIERLSTEVTGRTRPLRVLPQIRAAWLVDLVRTHPTANLSSKAVETRPFDLAANAARLLLDRPEFNRIWRMWTDGRRPSLQPHLVIVGLGELGMAIVARAVQTNFAIPGCRLAVTVLDKRGEASAAELNARLPGLRDLVDWRFVEAVFEAENPAAWPQVWAAVETALANREPAWTTAAVIVALAQDRDSLHTALQMRERLDRLGSIGTPVFVRLRKREELGQFATRLDGPASLLDRMIAFGGLGELTSFDLLNDEGQDALAKALHETYLAGQPRTASGGSWDELPERLKQSNRAAASHIPTKLGSARMRLTPEAGPAIEFTAAEIETMSAVEHHRWMIEREAVGWMPGPRGSEPDPVAKRHPDLVGWDRLDEKDRDKDRDVVRTIPKSIAASGGSIRRERMIDATGDASAQAAAALAVVASREQAVVIFDPADPASLKIAADAAARGAKLWVLWHEGSHQRLVAPAPPSETMRAATEVAVSSREVAAIFGRAPSKTPRPRRKTAEAAHRIG